MEKEWWTHLLIHVAFKETPLDSGRQISIFLWFITARLSGDSNAAPSGIFPFSFWRTIAVWRLKMQTNSLFGVRFFFFLSVPFLNALQWEETRTNQPYLHSMWEEEKLDPGLRKCSDWSCKSILKCFITLSLSLAMCIWCLNGFF